MKRLNPLYILALIVTILIISFVSLDNKRSQHNSLSKNTNSLEQKAKSFKDTKDSWFNAKRVEKQIDRIINSSIFKKAKILKAQNGKLIKVKIETLNQKILDKFLNRVLNEKIILKKLEIKKTSIYFEVEVN